MKKYILIALLGLLSLGSSAQRLQHVLKELPPLPTTGIVSIHAREDTEGNKFVFDIVKPDTLAVDRVVLVSGKTKRVLLTPTWTDCRQDPFESQFFTIPLGVLHTDSVDLYLEIWKGSKLIEKCRLEQRLHYGRDYMDFFGISK